MFRTIISPIFSNTRLCLQLVACWWPGWAGTQPCHQHANSSVYYTTSCKHSLVLLKMDEITARNTLSWSNLLINCYCCICLYIVNDAVLTTGVISHTAVRDHWNVGTSTRLQGFHIPEGSKNHSRSSEFLRFYFTKCSLLWLCNTTNNSIYCDTSHSRRNSSSAFRR